MKKILISVLFVSLVFPSCLRNKGIDPGKIDSNAKLQDYLLLGWNTWDSPGALNFIYLPEGLSLNLSFRASYNSAVNYFPDHANCYGAKEISPVTITPLAHSFDERYIDMILSWEGMKARIQVVRERRDIMILFTPIEIPENPPLMILQSGVHYNKSGRIEKKNGIIQADVSQKTFAVQSSSPELNIPLSIDGPYLCVSTTEETAFFTGYGRTFDKIKEFVEKRRSVYEQQKEKYGDLAQAYYVKRMLLGWNLIYDPLNNRAISSAPGIWTSNNGSSALFNWDSYFSATLFAFDNKYFAYSNAIAITNSILPEGFIENPAIALDNSADNISQPPVGSMVCKLIYEKYNDKWFLEEVFENLFNWNQWWDKTHNNKGFLSWRSSPGIAKDTVNNQVLTVYESGMENSPLFDDAVINGETHLLELASVDLLSLYITDCNALAFIAGELNKEQEKNELLERAAKYGEKLKELWDDEAGIYKDKNLITNEFSKHLAPTSFYPLLTGMPSHEQAERMINGYFMNPDEFFGDFMLPSISKRDSAFYENNYWRGRIWAPMNFLVYMGLRNYDLPEARKALAEKSLALITKEWKSRQTVFENYNAITGMGSDVSNNGIYSTWSGLFALIPLMEGGYW